MIRYIVRGWHSISGALGVIASVLVMGLVIGMVADVAFRVINRTSVPGMFEVVELALAAAVYLGSPVTQRENGMIRVELLTSRLSGRVRKFVSVLSLSISLAVCALLATAALQGLLGAIATDEARIGLIAVSTWPSRLAIAVGVIVLAGEVMISLVKAAQARPDSLPPASESTNSAV